MRDSRSEACVGEGNNPFFQLHHGTDARETLSRRGSDVLVSLRRRRDQGGRVGGLGASEGAEGQNERPEGRTRAKVMKRVV